MRRPGQRGRRAALEQPRRKNARSGCRGRPTIGAAITEIVACLAPLKARVLVTAGVWLLVVPSAVIVWWPLRAAGAARDLQ